MSKKVDSNRHFSDATRHRVWNFFCSEEHLSFSVNLFAEHERLAAADNFASSALAGSALKLEGNLLGVLRLFAEHGLGLTTEASLFGIVSTFTLGGKGVLALLVLRNLVDGVLAALLAERVLLLRRVHLHE